MNEYQKIALQAYAGGEFNYIEKFDPNRSYGDTLFQFVMIELSDNEDCEDLDTAISRMESGIRDLQTVIDALQSERISA